MPRKLVVTRDVTPGEIEWLKRTYKKGDEIWKFTGATYGCINESKGMACSDVEGEGPFFEFPLDALDYAPMEPVEVRMQDIVQALRKNHIHAAYCEGSDEGRFSGTYRCKCWVTSDDITIIVN